MPKSKRPDERTATPEELAEDRSRIARANMLALAAQRVARPHSLDALTQWMRLHLQNDGSHLFDGYDVNMTLLAENCAHAHDHDEWLDDETHVIWDAAVSAARWYEALKKDS